MTDQTSQPSAPRWQAWRPAGLVFLALSLAALAAGVFPDRLLPARMTSAGAAPPALSVLLAGQTVLLVLFFAFAWARKSAGAVGLGRQVLSCLIEFLFWVVPCLPLYVMATWLANATAGDALRGVGFLSCVWVLAAGLAIWSAADRPAISTAIALACGLLALAWPVAAYFAIELGLSDIPGGPVTAAYLTAAARGGTPLALWQWLAWPVAGVALILARLALPATTLGADNPFPKAANHV